MRCSHARRTARKLFASAGVGTPNYLQDRARDRQPDGHRPGGQRGASAGWPRTVRAGAFDVSQATRRILACADAGATERRGHGRQRSRSRASLAEPKRIASAAANGRRCDRASAA